MCGTRPSGPSAIPLLGNFDILLQFQPFRASFASENSLVNMFDVALSSAGASIALVTSFDENYPPENIIDG